MVLVSWCRCTLTTAVLNKPLNFGFFLLNTEWSYIHLTISFFNSCEMALEREGFHSELYAKHTPCMRPAPVDQTSSTNLTTKRCPAVQIITHSHKTLTSNMEGEKWGYLLRDAKRKVQFMFTVWTCCNLRISCQILLKCLMLNYNSDIDFEAACRRSDTRCGFSLKADFVSLHKYCYITFSSIMRPA